LSQGFSLDNEGTGFVFDDDEDLEAILERAGAAEGRDDEDTSLLFADTPPAAIPASPAVAAVVDVEPDDLPTFGDDFSLDLGGTAQAPQIYEEPAPVYQEPAYTPQVAPEPTPQPEHYTPEPVKQEFTPAFVPEAVMPTPAYTPEPYQKPELSATPTSVFAHVNPAAVAGGLLPVGVDEDFLATAIRVLDSYRALDRDVQKVVSQFVTSGERVFESEAELIIAVLQVDRTLGITMRALRDAKGLDPMERAFYIMELDISILKSLGDLISIFTGSTLIFVPGETISFARSLVKEIEQLDSRSISYVEATESVLAATIDAKE
jgi:hypothetical protein